MGKKPTQLTIHAQLAPLIKATGIREIARRTGIDATHLSKWVNRRDGRRLGDAQVDAVCVSLGTRVVIV